METLKLYLVYFLTQETKIREDFMGLNQTPRSNQLHIGIFGKRNSGKSTLINAITGQDVSLISDTPGTTTDPVYKTMEIFGIGPCVLIDTAGFDDDGELGLMRVEKTKQALDKTDVALIVICSNTIDVEKEWIDKCKKRGIPFIIIINKIDELKDTDEIYDSIFDVTGETPLLVSAKDRTGIDKIKDEIIRKLPEEYEAKSITGDLVEEGDVVVLVMPQDIQAPKGRLILPQVQTIRDLLDHKCMIMSCTTDKFKETLDSLKNPPKLIITDSQVFPQVYENKPEESLLTSFSVLFARHKGDIKYFVEGAKQIGKLDENSRVLIAEACTHAPLEEDIGREKIPGMLRKRISPNLRIDMVSGSDFPEDLSAYDLIIHCGACMFNKKHVMSRVEKAKAQEVPVTNYGVTIAYLIGILDKVVY